MSKPASMSDKEYLIRTLAVKLALNEKTIEAVVNHQFQSANEAMGTNHSIELSGFGKFVYNLKKAKTKLVKLHEKEAYIQSILDDVASTDNDRRRASVMMSKLKDQMKLLKPTIEHD